MYWFCVAPMCFVKSLPPGLFLLPQLHAFLSMVSLSPAWGSKEVDMIYLGEKASMPKILALIRSPKSPNSTTLLLANQPLHISRWHSLGNITVYLFPIPQRGDLLCPGTTKMEGTDRASLRELIDGGGGGGDPDPYQCKKRSSVLNMQFLRWLAEISGARDGATKI